jgi:deoxycytidine triphosphate deaminase
MALLTYDDIVSARKKGDIQFDNSFEVNATSIDVRVEQLYTIHIDPSEQSEVFGYSDEEFKEKCLRKKESEDGFWLLVPTERYAADLAGDFLLKPPYTGKITSRSSWARLGCFCEHLTDNLSNNAYRVFEGKIQIRIFTFGTVVKLRPGDALASLMLFDESKTPYVSPAEVRKMLLDGSLEITSDGKQVSEERLACNGNIFLTRDEHVKIYSGEILDPKKPNDKAFTEKKISDDGLYIPRGTFFISSSKEEVKIPSHLYAEVHITNYFNPGENQFNTHPVGFTTMFSHPNAPRIDPYPRFQGKITFENYPHNDTIIFSNEYLTFMNIFRLSSPYKHREELASRYKGQDKATNSRSHIK